MTKITIIGSGITGMTIASQLPKHYDITIVARNLPGDSDSQEWSSPWAGAVWMGKVPSNEFEQKIQLESFYHWWKLAYTNPESSVRRIEFHDLIDEVPLEKVWYREKLPDFRVLKKDELPPGAPFGMVYKTIVLTPTVFLPWLRKRLEDSGVKFQRMTVPSISSLKGMGSDVVVNATGVGARYLQDCADESMTPVRGQTVLVKTNFDKIWIRRGKDYTYALSRLDGTAILGGFKSYGDLNTTTDVDMRADVFRRINENLPKEFPSKKPEDFTIVRDIVGIRPERLAGVRIAKDVVEGQKVVHAIGHQGMYIAGWGVAREASRLIDELLSEDLMSAMPQAKL